MQVVRHVTKTKQKKWYKNPKRIGVVETRFASRQKENFGSLNLKFETGTRVQIVKQSLKLSTGHWASAQNICRRAFVLADSKKELPRIAHASSEVRAQAAGGHRPPGLRELRVLRGSRDERFERRLRAWKWGSRRRKTPTGAPGAVARRVPTPLRHFECKVPCSHCRQFGRTGLFVTVRA
jgi:hypothetical protein